MANDDVMFCVMQLLQHTIRPKPIRRKSGHIGTLNTAIPTEVCM